MSGLCVVVAPRGARHGMDYDRLENRLVGFGLETLSATVRVCSNARTIEDRRHDLALEKKLFISLSIMPYLERKECCKLTATTSQTILRNPFLCSNITSSCDSVC